MLHRTINRPWNFHSEVKHCGTCDGIGRVASHERPSTWNPYPETACDDCGGRDGVEPCEVCGSDLHVPGYDCFACASVDELPVHALADLDGFVTALRAAATAKLLGLSDRRAA